MKKYQWFLVLVLIVIVGGFGWFYRLYQTDMQNLKNFVGAYQKFDAAPSAESLKELQTAAQVRISSLIKNEKQVMDTTRAIADLAKQELISPGLKSQRQAAFASFVDLGK